MIIDNRDRARSTYEALDAYRVWKHTVPMDDVSDETAWGDHDDKEQIEEDITDLISSLCHYMRTAGIDPAAALAAGFSSFLAEEADPSGATDGPDVALTVGSPVLENTLADIESMVGDKNAFGCTLEDPAHPWHETVKRLRAVTAGAR